MASSASKAGAAKEPLGLFSPLQIGTITVPNRLMQTAHSKQYSDRVESQREVDYFVRRAQGGCGLFIAGNHFVHPSTAIRNFEDAWRPESVAANRRLTDAVHESGSAMFVQLNHHGAQAMPEGPDGPRPIYAPSRLISPSTGHATREASVADIRMLTRGWADSAALAREGGFDGVEIHMAHGYLLHQFLSPLYNRRTDSYGGDLAGRTRFSREVLRAVRERVGDDFVVGIRIVANEFHPDGLDAAALREVIAVLREEARIDFLDLAAGGYHNVHYVFPSSPMPTAWLRDEVAAIKAANPDTPVFGVGAASSPEEATEVITSGTADMVALTRAQIADPDLALKLREGRPETIRHCIRLNQGCLGRPTRGLPMSCTVNPDAGREGERAATSVAERSERWLVVGGGPAGMRAAIELAESGHAVTLVERENFLGGQLRLARTVPGRESIGLLIDDLTAELIRHGVDVRCGVEATEAMLNGDDLDGVVLATGATPPLMGTGLAVGGAFPHGYGDSAVFLDPWRIFREPRAAGRRVAVVDDDGTAYASGVLLALTAAGVNVELVTPFETVFPHVGSGYERPLLLETLGGSAFDRHVSSIVQRAERGRLEILDTLTGRYSTLENLDAVVHVAARASDTSLKTPAVDAAETRVLEIGDRVAPRTIDSAIFEAVEVGRDVGVVARAHDDARGSLSISTREHFP